MALLFALVPCLIALAIFVGTFRLAGTRTPAPRAPVKTAVAARAPTLRTPLPVGAVRRTGPAAPEARA